MYYPAENYTSGQKENDPIGHHHRWFNSGFIWEIIPVAGRVLKFWFGKCSFPRYALILLWGIYRISHVPHDSACISSYKQLYTRLSNILIRLVRASSTFRCGQSFTNIFVIMRPDGWPNNNPTINTKNMKKKHDNHSKSFHQFHPLMVQCPPLTVPCFVYVNPPKIRPGWIWGFRVFFHRSYCPYANHGAGVFYLQNWVIFRVNVGKYSIAEAFG